MAAKLNLLSVPQCNAVTSEGKAIRKLHDGGGLFLWVYEDGSKFWRLRYWIANKEKALRVRVWVKMGWVHDTCMKNQYLIEDIVTGEVLDAD